MPFDLGSAQDVTDEAPAAAPAKRKFDLASAQDVTDTPAEEPGYFKGVANASTRVTDTVKSPLGAAKGFLEGAANLATNAVAPIPAVARRLLSATGITPDDGSYAKAREQFVYTPRSAEGAAVVDQNSAILKPVGDLLSGASNAAATGVETFTGPNAFTKDLREGGADLLAAAATGASLGRGAAAKTPKPEPTAIARTPEQVARAAGLKILPSQADSAPLGTVAETIAGSPRLAKSLSKANAAQVANILAEELGLKKGTKLTPEQFAQLREPLNGAYKAVSEQLGTLKADPALKTAISKVGGQKGLTTNRQVARLRDQYSSIDELPAAQLVQEIRSLREKASSNIKTPFGTKDRVQLKDLGKAQQEIANALDDMLERGATASGRADLVKQYKEARVGLAKIGSVERAVQAPSGAAQSLAKQQSKGAPLTGGLKIVADSARAFPEVLGKPPVQSGLENLVDTATLGLRGAVASPVIRSLLESNVYQNSIGRAAPKLGPGSAVGAYFDNGQSGLPARRPKGPIPEVGRGSDAGRLAGDLDLAPDGPLPGNPAYAGPPLRASDLAGDLGIAPDQLPALLDDSLRLIDESAPSRPIGRSSLAGELAGDLSIVPEELSLADDAPLAPQYVGGPLRASELAGDLRAYSPESRGSQLAKELDLQFVETPDGPAIQLPNGMGKIELAPTADGYRVIETSLDPSLQGRGLGTEMYLEAIEQAQNRGGVLKSDTSVSPSAQRVYDSLEQRGLDVERNPTWLDEFSDVPGTLTSGNSLRPAYTVRRKPSGPR